jgi:hypothetical protein
MEVVTVEEFALRRGEEGLEVFCVGDQGLFLAMREDVDKVFVVSELFEIDEVKERRDGW